jgi:hypothetical protein
MNADFFETADLGSFLKPPMDADKTAKANIQTQCSTYSAFTAALVIQTTSMRRDSRVESPLFLKIVGGFRRALSEWRAPISIKAKGIISPRVAQPPTIFRKSGNRALLRGDSSGPPSFGYFSWRSKKSDLPPGNPRQDCKVS